jgi:hypothetical protein
MRRRDVIFFMGVLIMLLSQAKAAVTGPVVVELFESQGCSSCPPAEGVMSRLRQEFDRSVILLTYHVDYWDSLGWKDSFSDRRYTDLQKQYGAVFNQDSIYTPEMVVNGEVGFIGSDRDTATDQVRSRIAASQKPFILSVKKTEDGAAVHVELPASLASAARQLTVVVYEDAPPVHVLRGENAGVTMSGDSAVRTLLPLSLDRSGRAEAAIVFQHPWNPAKLKIAVLVRGDPIRILAAQEANWP